MNRPRGSIRRLWPLLLLLPAALGGCGGKSFSILEALFGPSGKKLVAMATDPADADRRREGIIRLSEQSWGMKYEYLNYFAFSLRYDPDPSVRGVAARALGRAGDPKYLPDLVLGLMDKDPTVRWDVAVALQSVLGEQAIDPLRDAAANDASVDVRMAAARALRNYRQPRVLATLVRRLDDETFEVRNEAHESLVRLTGKDLGYESADWAPVLSAELPPPTPRWQRPWWDWFGVSRNWARYRQAPAQPTGAYRPWWDWFGTTRRSRPSGQVPAGARQRPWWDWMGLTAGRGQPAPPGPATATAPTTAPATAGG